MKPLALAAFVCSTVLVLSAPASAGSGGHEGHHGSSSMSAQASHGGHAAHRSKAKTPSKIAGLPSVKAYKKGMDVMHRDMNISYTGHVDVDFVRGMIPHHQGAVDMAEVVLKHGKDEIIRGLAKNIKAAQLAEIGMMNRWLYTRGYVPADQKKCQCIIGEYERAMEVMHRDMDISYTGDADLDFVNGMIPHHQGAIDMAWVVVRHGNDPEVIKFTRDVIRDQTNEIALMEGWRDRYLAKLKAEKGECTRDPKSDKKSKSAKPVKAVETSKPSEHQHHSK